MSDVIHHAQQPIPGATEQVMEGAPEFSYRVVIIVAFQPDRAYTHYFEKESAARAFYETVRAEGYRLPNGWVVLKNGMKLVTLEGDSGVTIRPPTATLLSKTKLS